MIDKDDTIPIESAEFYMDAKIARAELLEVQIQAEKKERDERIKTIEAVNAVEIAALEAKTVAIREQTAALKERNAAEKGATGPSTAEAVPSGIEPEISPEAEPPVEFKIGDKFIVDGTECKIVDITSVDETQPDGEQWYMLAPEDDSRNAQPMKYDQILKLEKSESKEADEKKTFESGDKVTVDTKDGKKEGRIIGDKHPDGKYAVLFENDSGEVSGDNYSPDEIELKERFDKPGQELVTTGDLDDPDDPDISGPPAEVVYEGSVENPETTDGSDKNKTNVIEEEEADWREDPDVDPAEMSQEDAERLDGLKATVDECHKAYIEMSRNKQRILIWRRPKEEKQQEITDAYLKALSDLADAKYEIEKRTLGLTEKELEVKTIYDSIDIRADQLKESTRLTNELDEVEVGGRYEAIANWLEDNPTALFGASAAILGASLIAMKLGMPSAATAGRLFGRLFVGSLCGGGIGGMARGAIEFVNAKKESRYLDKISGKFEQQKTDQPLDAQEQDDLLETINELGGYVAELQAKRVATGRQSERSDELLKKMIEYGAEAEKKLVQKQIDEGKTFEEIMINLALRSDDGPEIDLGDVINRNEATSKNARERRIRAVVAATITGVAVVGSVAYSLLTADNANASAVQGSGAGGGGGDDTTASELAGSGAGTGASQEAIGTAPPAGTGDTVNVFGFGNTVDTGHDINTVIGSEGTTFGGGDVGDQQQGNGAEGYDDGGETESTNDSEVPTDFSDLKMPPGADDVWDKTVGETLHHQAVAVVDEVNELNGNIFTPEQRQTLIDELPDNWQSLSEENEGLGQRNPVRLYVNGQLFEDILRNKGKL